MFFDLDLAVSFKITLGFDHQIGGDDIAYDFASGKDFDITAVAIPDDFAADKKALGEDLPPDYSGGSDRDDIGRVDRPLYFAIDM